MRNIHTILIGLVLCFYLNGVLAAGQVFSSGERQTVLLELYTSEGCSSCPPADRWLSRFTANPQLWRTIVPVAFHVDYWNYLGWKDRFSSAAYSERQRLYASKGYARTVYTPGFFKNGREWRGWFLKSGDVSNDAPPAVGSLEVILAKDALTASFSPRRPVAQSHILHVAQLGAGLKSDVLDGENGGKILNHDFVVLSLQRFHTDASSAIFQWRVAQSRMAETAFPVKAMAFWVTAPGNPTPLQATGGWITP